MIAMLAVVLAAQGAVQQGGAAPQQDSFPHLPHVRLFTTCASCHEGIVSGDSAQMRPTPAACNECHDGDMVRRVSWQPRQPRPTNLHFDHRTHMTRIAASGQDSLPCARCHAETDTTEFMNVSYGRPERCVTCHAHEAPSHFAAEARCQQCHVPLAQATRLAAADIARIPEPPSHDSAWVGAHGRVAADDPSCATCHTRESCTICHVNAARVPAIQQLAPDERVAALLRGRRPTYPEPASHRAGSFIREHGQQAAAPGASCANCHARNSCLTCHRDGEQIAVVAGLPARQRGGAAGVDLAGTRPPDHVPGFSRRHAAVAAGGDATCQRCHAPSFCASCHDAASAPGFHPPNFVQRHAQSAFTAETECASCHQTETFCRDCHRQSGRMAAGARGAYHDRESLWVFAHGAVARRSIETCASCHRQVDCLQCHSASTGWKVNPHGRGFDAAGMESRNPGMCRRCHVTGTP